MGAGASVPDEMDAAAAKEIGGASFNQVRFDKVATDGKITKDQLLAFFLEREKLLAAFQQVDSDHSGKIDKEEMGTLLESLDIDRALTTEIMTDIDKDGDGQIDFDEWMEAINLGTGSGKLEQALTLAMDQTGKIKGFLSLDELFQKRKEQCKALKADGSPEALEELKKREGQMEMYSAKLKAIAISEEKKLYRVFSQIDADKSGLIDKEELKQAMVELNLAVADADKIFEALGGGSEGISFAQFKGAVKMGGGRKFEKALTAKVTHGGEVADFKTLEQKLEQYKSEVATLEVGVAADPENAELKNDLAKAKAQGDMVAAKLKAIAADENKKLKDIFDSIDNDHSGEIDMEELSSAMEQMELTEVTPDKIMSKFAPGKKLITFEEFKNAVKLGGGRAFEKALTTYVDPTTGKAKGFLTLDELFQKRKEQCKALKEKGTPEATEELKKREGQMEALSAKLIGVAIADEKKLYRVFQQIDTDHSGKLDRGELIQAVKYLNLDLAKGDQIVETMMAGKEEITWPEFKELINLQGGRSFEKALGSKVTHGGEMANYASLEEELEKRKEQCAKLEASTDPADAEELKKVKQQGEVIAAKLRTMASIDLKILKDTFASFDTDGGGTIDLAELKAAMASLDMTTVDADELMGKLGTDGQITFEQWKEAIKVGGGRKFEAAITRRVGPDGNFYKAA